MQYTTNYNLITVEGTDVVNPLVQMNPNFTDIDAAMFANKQASIGNATEITVGTVHSITRGNADSNYFRFTATSNWTAGDSMTVDGNAVSVYLTDGTTPATGAYVINSEVFGIIAGSRVTLYLASAPVSSLDADQITFDPSGTSLDPSDTDVDKAIREISTSVDSINNDVDSLINGTGWQILGAGISYIKLGSVVYLAITTTDTGSAWALAGTLPAGYRPSRNVYQTLYSAGTTFSNVYVTPAGAINVRGNAAFDGMISFPVI